MASVNRSRWKNLKPPQGGSNRLDWDNPLSRNLASYFIFNEGVGGPQDLVRPRSTTLIYDGLYPDWEITSEGFWSDFITTESYSADVSLTGGVFTFAAKVRIETRQINGFETVLSRYSYASETNNQGWRLFLHSDVNKWCYAVGNNNSSGTQNLFSSFTVNDNTNYSLACTSDGTTRKFYIYNSVDAQTTDNPIPLYAAAQFYGGYRCRLHYAGVWNRCLSADEIKNFHDEPFQLVATETRRSYFFPAQLPQTTVPIISAKIIRGNSQLLDGLISWWGFNEPSGMRKDSHGINYLTDNNGVGFGASPNGGYAAFDNAAKSHFSCPDNSLLRTGDLSWTFACWFNSGTTSQLYHIIASKHDGNTIAGSEWFVGWSSSSDKIGLAVYHGTSDTTTLESSFGAIAHDGTPYFVVVWHDSVRDEIGISVNGIVDTASWTLGLNATTESFRIGNIGGTGIYNWQGAIDEAAFWKRVLTPQEREFLYSRRWIINNVEGAFTYEDVKYSVQRIFAAPASTRQLIRTTRKTKRDTIQPPTEQLRIDWTHDLSRNLILCMIPDREITPMDLVSGRRPSIYQVGFGHGLSRFGWSLDLSSGGNVKFPPASMPTDRINSAVSVFMIARHLNTTGTSWTFAVWDANQGYPIVTLGFDYNSLNIERSLLSRFADGGSFGGYYAGNVDLTGRIDQYDRYGLTASTVNDSLYFYVDGQPDGQFFNSNLPGGTADCFTGLGIANYNAPSDNHSDVVAVYVWDRQLSHQEMKLLYDEPYCFIESLVQRQYFFGPDVILGTNFSVRPRTALRVNI